MVEIEEMNDDEIRETLKRLNYAHLACSKDDLPYVVPVHYAYDGEHIFIYTTEGKKAEMLRANPELCLQAEEVTDKENWISVIAFGRAEQLVDEDERSAALDKILEVNPRLTPAVSIRWMDSWVRENVEVIYRVRPRKMTGRRTVDRLRGREPVTARTRPPEVH
jgi:nitroimidazol reductase NimA-like FMN-containing flavoprotein (pyridoxamine 5'-phosphate oxidase superfamily)